MNKTQVIILGIALSAGALFAPAEARATFKILSPGNSITVACQDRNNCSYTGIVAFANDTDQKLYDTTVYANGSSHSTLQFIGFDGNWTTRSTTDKVIEPGESLGVEVKASFLNNSSTANLTKWREHLYIDGKTCNFLTHPPDCIYHGGEDFTIIFEIKESPTPTPVIPTATPTPTIKIQSPLPSNTPAPSPTALPSSPTPTPTTTLIVTPTPTPKITNSAPTNNASEKKKEDPSQLVPTEENQKPANNNTSKSSPKKTIFYFLTKKSPKNLKKEEVNNQEQPKPIAAKLTPIKKLFIKIQSFFLKIIAFYPR